MILINYKKIHNNKKMNVMSVEINKQIFINAIYAIFVDVKIVEIKI